MIYYIIAFSILTICITMLVSFGITQTPKKQTQELTNLKNISIGINSTVCEPNGLTGEIVSCNDEDIFGYENGNQYCNSICKESGRIGTTMECVEIENSVKKGSDGENSVNKNKVCMKGDSVKTDCSFEHGGKYIWSGSSNSDSMGWKCLCQWPQYAGGENCRMINRNICGMNDDTGSHCEVDSDCYSQNCMNNNCSNQLHESICTVDDDDDCTISGSGTFDWDATKEPPEDATCNCKPGYVLLKSQEGKPDICVKNENKSFYNDVYDVIHAS